VLRPRSALAVLIALTTLIVAPAAEAAKRPRAGADLALRVSQAPNPIDVGQKLTYTLTVRNKGPLDATDVVLTSSPDKVVLDSVETSQGTCNEDATSCALGPVASGSTAVVTIVVVPLIAGVLRDPVGVQGAEPDPKYSNNLAVISTKIQPARIDLSSAITASSDTVTIPSDLTLTAIVSNAGPDPASDVSALLDVHHAGDNGVDLVLRSVSSTVGTCTSDGSIASELQIQCDLGLMAPGENATIAIDVVPLTPGTIASTVHAVAQSSLGKWNERDIDETNNIARVDSHACLPVGC